MFYTRKPMVVEVTFGLDTGKESQIRESCYLVGVSPDQVRQALEKLKPSADEPKKVRKARRTAPASGRTGEELAGATEQTTGKSAGEQAMDRLKKEAEPKESVWP